uniref:phosphatase PAP2 family protein n=1 Tax=Pararhizobium sp. IMCC3301 TaxID=3067904 RepID=UPI0027428F29|nr:phosphatase PAP2 family protein [Pararhizobium sp. IMCC3301]
MIGTLRGWWMILASIAAALLLTALLVMTGMDWAYFVLIQNVGLFGPLMVADGFGYAFPVLLSGGLMLAGVLRPGRGYGFAGVAALIAASLALVVSMTLKAFSGRASPPHHNFGLDLANADNSAAFKFGFMNEALLGGWPSSHATVAFAVAVAVAVALPAARALHHVSFALAAFIGIGVTFGFHWLSEFLSGALIGATIGIWVGSLAAARGVQSKR